MHYNSSLDLVMCRIPIALTMAVIFSGGTVDIKLMNFTIPPLGTGIKSMRKAIEEKKHESKNKSLNLPTFQP